MREKYRVFFSNALADADKEKIYLYILAILTVFLPTISLILGTIHSALQKRNRYNLVYRSFYFPICTLAFLLTCQIIIDQSVVGLGIYQTGRVLQLIITVMAAIDFYAYMAKDKINHLRSLQFNTYRLYIDRTKRFKK